MRFTVPAAALATALLLGTANAALQTRTFDGVEAEVADRYAAMEGETLTRAERRLRRTYGLVLAKFAKESTTRRRDARFIGQIVRKLNRTHRDDAEMQGLLGDALAGFIGELGDTLDRVDRAEDALVADGRFRNRAANAYERALGSIAKAGTEDALMRRLRFCERAERQVGRAVATMNRAMQRDPNVTAHEQAFLMLFGDAGYTGANDCMTCHPDAGEQMLDSGHFEWSGVSENIEGHETHEHGKVDLLNNFCIAIPSNEPRCTQCHAGFDWKNQSYDTTDASKIDCLICHDTTGTYKKDLKTAGAPVPGIDLTEVAINVGAPSRATCGACHFFAGGGDNVKHGDLASTLASTTRAYDVHMGTDGEDMACQQCHSNENHDVGGMPLHSQDEGTTSCEDCHGARPHATSRYNDHAERIACQTCHIKRFSRDLPTKMEWYWADAGQNVDPIPMDGFGKPLYDKKKGTFVWAKDVEPELRWFNGKWRRMMIGENDTYTTTPVQLAEPVGSKDDPGAKIYPFKKMIGNQPADLGNQRIVVPHLFGLGSGPNPFWGKFDWGLAIAEGAAYTGVPYSGTWGFVETEMLLSLNHEIAPKEEARSCGDCHGGGIDFTKLGYSGDPAD